MKQKNMPQTRSKTLAAKGGGNKGDKDGSYDSDAEDEQEDEQKYRGQGRQPGALSAEDYWTRVLSPCYRQIDYQQKFNINVDLENELESWQEQEEYEDNISWPIFLPDE